MFVLGTQELDSKVTTLYLRNMIQQERISPQGFPLTIENTLFTIKMSIFKDTPKLLCSPIYTRISLPN
jgi:hypothetical protein